MPIDLDDPKMDGYVPLQPFIDQDGDQSSRIRDIPYGKKRQEVTFSLITMTFGDTGRTYESPSQVVTITNIGYDTVNIYGSPVEGEFVVKSAVPAWILPGETISVQIAFAPTTLGAHTGSVYFDTGAAVGPEYVALSGTAIEITATFPTELAAFIDGRITPVTDTKLAKASNLSDVVDKALGRQNLGVKIGVDVQAYDADLSALAAVPSTPYGRAVLSATDAADLGGDFAGIFQAINARLTSWAAIVRTAAFDVFAATPSSANLRATLTDETGTGVAVFNDTPTILTPNLTGVVLPTTNGGATLGSVLKGFANAFLFANAKINFDNGNVIIEHLGLGRIKLTGNFSRGKPIVKTANFGVLDTENWLINNKAGSTCVVTLPDPTLYEGRELKFNNNVNFALNSAVANVVPLAGGAAVVSILSASSSKWATLVSDGVNWLIMEAN